MNTQIMNQFFAYACISPAVPHTLLYAFTSVGDDGVSLFLCLLYTFFTLKFKHKTI